MKGRPGSRRRTTKQNDNYEAQYIDSDSGRRLAGGRDCVRTKWPQPARQGERLRWTAAVGGRARGATGRVSGKERGRLPARWSAGCLPRRGTGPRQRVLPWSARWHRPAQRERHVPAGQRSAATRSAAITELVVPPGCANAGHPGGDPAPTILPR